MSNVVVLFGGNGTENMVSCASAQHFSEILPGASLRFWQQDGAVVEVTALELQKHENVFLNPFLPKTISKRWKSVEESLDELRGSDASVLLSLHGGDGENGWIQRHCENRKLAFTGSDSQSSAIAIDKTLSKERVRTRGVRLAEQLAFKASDAGAKTNLEAFQRQFGSIVIKPSNEGSSTNLSFIHDAAQLATWWKEHEGSKISWLSEEFLKGREFTIGIIMHRGCLMALPPSEVILERNAEFDYKGKYLGIGNREITPAELSPKKTAEVQEAVLLAHCALGCYGYTRSEVIMTDRGVYYLETNTLPGFTKRSFIPQQLAAAGIEVQSFVSEQLALAKAR